MFVERNTVKSSTGLRTAPEFYCARHGAGGECGCDEVYDISVEGDLYLCMQRHQELTKPKIIKWMIVLGIVGAIVGYLLENDGFAAFFYASFATNFVWLALAPRMLQERRFKIRAKAFDALDDGSH